MTTNMHVQLNLTPDAQANFIVRTGQIWDGSARLDLTDFSGDQRGTLLSGLGLPDADGKLDARTYRGHRTEAGNVPGSVNEWLVLSAERAIAVQVIEEKYRQARKEDEARAAQGAAATLKRSFDSLAEYEAVDDESLKIRKPGVGMPHVDPVTPEIRARLEICKRRHQNLWLQGEEERRNAWNEKTLSDAEAATDAQLLSISEPSLYTPASTGHQSRRSAIRARLTALRGARKAERLTWILEHGSEHLRSAATNGYDCKRLYSSERATFEYPGYVLDYDDEARYTDVNCPLQETLKEALRVKGNVVFLTGRNPENSWPRLLPRGGQAVVIQNFLGEYNLLRPYEKGEESDLE